MLKLSLPFAIGLMIIVYVFACHLHIRRDPPPVNDLISQKFQQCRTGCLGLALGKSSSRWELSKCHFEVPKN